METITNKAIDSLLQSANEMAREKVRTRQEYNRKIAGIVSHFIERFPDLRFCQIIYMLGITDSGEDTFNEEPCDTYEKMRNRAAMNGIRDIINI